MSLLQSKTGFPYVYLFLPFTIMKGHSTWLSWMPGLCSVVPIKFRYGQEVYLRVYPRTICSHLWFLTVKTVRRYLCPWVLEGNKLHSCSLWCLLSEGQALWGSATVRLLEIKKSPWVGSRVVEVGKI
jgi:hypothetical protein